jgi:hypothetical protein
VLKLRRGIVVGTDPLTVQVGEEERPAWADSTLVGEMHVGDEVVVNVEARDLGLGSGGFDIVHVNLTRGLEGGGAEHGEHVMKLNYTSLQHPVEPAEPLDPVQPDELGEDSKRADRGRVHDALIAAGEEGGVPPALVIPLHGHLAPAAWAAQQRRPGIRLGFVQGPGGAIAGSLSRDVIRLRAVGLLCDHITAGAAHGGEREAVSLVGGLDAAVRRLHWDAIIIGPGPGILGSQTRFGHGGMAALDGAHAALAVGLPVLVSPRLSSSDPRSRHRGLSHHTATVLALLLAAVRVPVPETEVEGWPLLDVDAPEGGSPQAALDALIELCGGRHDIAVERIDLDGYAASGLPQTTMGRTISEDPLFFAAALAAGAALAGAAAMEG